MFVCVCVYMFVCVCMCVCVCCLSVFLYVSACLSFCVCMCLSMSVFLYLLYVSVSLCLCLCLSVCVPFSVFLGVCLSFFLSKQMLLNIMFIHITYLSDLDLFVYILAHSLQRSIRNKSGLCNWILCLSVLCSLFSICMYVTFFSNCTVV